MLRGEEVRFCSFKGMSKDLNEVKNKVCSYLSGEYSRQIQRPYWEDNPWGTQGGKRRPLRLNQYIISYII